MRGAYSVCLTYPKRETLHMNHLDFSKALQLEFYHLDMMISRLFVLFMKWADQSGFKPAVFNAANETAVYAFLDDKIAFGDIYKVVTSVLNLWDLKMTLH